MSAVNTSFEHILFNLQVRDRIVEDVNEIMEHLTLSVQSTECIQDTLIYSLDRINDRLTSIYASYKQTIERFNIGIISFVSDYYAIVDQHSNQFHSKYLHNYSGQIGHYDPILSRRVSSQFNVGDLINIFKSHCYNFKRFKIYTDSSHLRRAREKTWIIYQKLSNYIASENVYDLSDVLMHEFNVVAIGIHNLTEGKSKIKLTQATTDLLSKVKKAIQQFHSIKLEFKSTEEDLDYCECGNIMQVMSGTSEIMCDHCGFIFELKGTIFDDSQFYSQESTKWRFSGYEPSKHCRAWLERIQARETNTITQEQINKIEFCIKRDCITNKKRISIEQLRFYLKDTGLTELNEHVALLKKIITGIVPPQLSYSETLDITNSFSKAVKGYNHIRPTNKSNFIFYPFILLKLIEMHVSDYIKRKCLLSFIHLQGTQTLIQNDQIWQKICNITPGFVYRATDRYEYMS